MSVDNELDVHKFRKFAFVNGNQSPFAIFRMSKLTKTDAGYYRWIQDLKERYRRSQIKVATQVNREMLRFYWSLGRDIVARDAENVYGSGFYRNLSQDLKAAIPEAEGFSRQNLQYMKKLYLLYREESANCPQLVGNSETEICPQLVGISQDIHDDIIFSVPWGHHRTLIDKYFEKRERETALFYVHKMVEEGWSRNVLKSFMDTSLHLRQGKALTSFSRLLPAPDSDLAQELTKDLYIYSTLPKWLSHTKSAN